MSQELQPASSSELLIVAVFSRHEEALRWAKRRLERTFGSVGLVSPPYLFNQTQYYEGEMGTGLQKRFLAFANLYPANQLAEAKLRTIELEQELAASGGFPESRPLNLDPGLLCLGKFVLATTKDQAHRIFLRKGIFAEVTLRFQDGEYHPWPWTYADYCQPVVLQFMKKAREFYKRIKRKEE